MTKKRGVRQRDHPSRVAKSRVSPAKRRLRGRLRDEEEEEQEDAGESEAPRPVVDFHALSLEEKLEHLITLREHCLRTLQVHTHIHCMVEVYSL
jgi:hypothetical protein